MAKEFNVQNFQELITKYKNILNEIRNTNCPTQKLTILLKAFVTILLH